MSYDISFKVRVAGTNRYMNPPPNGWGTVEGTKEFFLNILDAWDRFKRDYATKDFVSIATFWIE